MNNLMVMPVMELAEAKERRNALVRFTRDIMVEGVDFGTVPGSNKQTLLKPGAEKLSTFFGLTMTFEDAGSIERWDDAEPLFSYKYRCRLFRGDMLVGEGLGSCNSRESKYRWRWVDESDLPPWINPANLLTRKSSIVEFEFAINKRQTEGQYGKPVEYWDAFESAIKSGEARQVSKKTRDGKELAAWAIDSISYRVPNEDIFSLVNTIDKMSQKRAMIAAVLVAVNASEFFTQDLEDLAEFANVVEGTATVVQPVVEPAKPEGKVSTDAMTQFWKLAKSMDGVNGADVLQDVGNDPAKGIELLQKMVETKKATEDRQERRADMTPQEVEAEKEDRELLLRGEPDKAIGEEINPAEVFATEPFKAQDIKAAEMLLEATGPEVPPWYMEEESASGEITVSDLKTFMAQHGYMGTNKDGQSIQEQVIVAVFGEALKFEDLSMIQRHNLMEYIKRRSILAKTKDEAGNPISVEDRLAQIPEIVESAEGKPATIKAAVEFIRSIASVLSYNKTRMKTL